MDRFEFTNLVTPFIDRRLAADVSAIVSRECFQRRVECAS
jgi:hypothetical protein